MSMVFVVDSAKQSLNPVHPGRARLLLKHGKAAIYRRCPFTLSAPHHAVRHLPRSGIELGGGSRVIQPT